MSILNLYNTNPVHELMYPELDSELTEQSSALHILTDFKENTPQVIYSGAPISEAELSMIQSHVRLKLVVDKNNHFLGIISLDDINHQEVVKKVSQGCSRQDLIVKDFLRRRESLKSLEYHELIKASIGDVIAALSGNGHQHCLVVDQECNLIRGIISASDIARKLKLPVNIQKKSSFAEISRTIQANIQTQSIVGF